MLAEKLRKKLDSHLYAFAIQDFCSNVSLAVMVIQTFNYPT